MNNNNSTRRIIIFFIFFCLFSSIYSVQVYQTAKNTLDRLSEKQSLSFSNNNSSLSSNIISINHNIKYQSIFGFGGAFTEAASLNFALLNPFLQDQVINAYWGQDGIGYSMGRVHMNSCDFCLFSYNFDNVSGDTSLQYFDSSVTHDQHTMIPFILRANKTAVEYGNPIWLFLTPWSPPAWMKVPVNGKQSMDGSASPNGIIQDDLQSWALYFSKFISAYKNLGVNIWGLTAQNEPEYAGTYEACLYTSEYESFFISNYLGPQIRKDFPNLKIMGYDHNRNDVYTYSSDLYSNQTTKDYLDGIAFHWYGGNELYNVNKTYWLDTDKFVLATEGCNCPGVELGDWERAETYGRDIIADLNFYSVGWVDWNLILNSFGGPNHVANYCDAMIIANIDEQSLYFQPSYYYMGQISKFIPRDSIRIKSNSSIQFPIDGNSTPYVENGFNIIVSDCNNAPNQQWNILSESNSQILLRNSTPMCLDVEDFNTNNGANVQVYSCGNSQSNQQWNYNNNTGEITSILDGKCMDVQDFSTQSGANVQLWDCGGTTNQQWIYNSYDGSIRSKSSNLCLTSGWTAFQHVAFETPNGNTVLVVMNSSDYKMDFIITDNTKTGQISTSIPEHAIQTYIF